MVYQIERFEVLPKQFLLSVYVEYSHILFVPHSKEFASPSLLQMFRSNLCLSDIHWTVTTQGSKAWLRETLCEDKINASRRSVEGSTKGRSKKSIDCGIKYVCPCCDTIMRATWEVNVICENCGELFERG